MYRIFWLGLLVGHHYIRYLVTNKPLNFGNLCLLSHFRADIDAAEHGVPGGRAVAAGPRHLRLLALHRLPRLERLRPQPPRHQVSIA